VNELILAAFWAAFYLVLTFYIRRWLEPTLLQFRWYQRLKSCCDKIDAVLFSWLAP